jgi:hypothetical protein
MTTIAKLEALLNEVSAQLKELKANEVKPLKVPIHPRWTSDEDARLLAADPASFPTGFPGRTKKACEMRRERLRGPRTSEPRSHWSEPDDLLLTSLMERKTDMKVIAQVMNRSVAAVDRRAVKLGLNVPRRRIYQGRIDWTPEQDAIIRRMVNQCATLVQIAEACGTRPAPTQSRIHKLLGREDYAIWIACSRKS